MLPPLLVQLAEERPVEHPVALAVPVAAQLHHVFSLMGFESGSSRISNPNPDVVRCSVQIQISDPEVQIQIRFY